MRTPATAVPPFLLLALAACGGGGGADAGVVPSATLSTLAADRLTAPADGTTAVLLTATVRAAGGTVLPGRQVRFEATGSGAVLQPPSVFAAPNGTATSRLTSTVAEPVTVAAVVRDGGTEVRLATTVTITFTPANAPLALAARYEDSDRSGTANAGDRVVVTFSKIVAVDGTEPSDFLLPVAADAFGTGASVVAGPAPEEVSIVLGSQPRLRTRGRFDAARTNANEPSGIAVGAASGIRADDGTPAGASGPVDVGPGFVPAATLPGGERVATGDLNGDGQQDVLVVTNAALVPQRGDGALVFVADPPVPSAPVRAVAIGNLNRVGADEVVTAVAAGLQVWNNAATTGPSALQAAALVATGDTRAVAIADLDGDAFPDLIAGTASGVATALHQRNLGNSFGSPVAVALGGAVVALRTGDLDGDGDPDVLAAVENTGVRVLRNDGGVLLPAELLPFAGVTALAAGAADGDARTDVVAAGPGGARLFRNTATGFVQQDLGAAANGTALGDVDGDSFADLLLRGGDGLLTLRSNDRSGAFVGGSTLGDGTAADVALADLDEDGDLDLVVAGATTAVLAGSLTGTFGTTELVPSVGLGLQDLGLQVLVDLDGDGVPDRATATGGGVRVLLGDGDGAFTEGATFGGSAPAAFVFGDLDGDLDPDCVLGFDGENRVYANAGDATFSLATGFGAGTDTRSLALADFDGDGDLDVIAGNDGANQVFLVAGSGSTITLALEPAAFTGLPPAAAGGETIALLPWDFDRDGDDDLAVIDGGTIVSPQDAFLLRRAGTGYTVLATLPAQLLARGAVLGDRDGDGRADLAIAQVSPPGNATVKVYRGLATTVSTLPENVPTPSPIDPVSLLLRDLDGDGRADLVLADGTTGQTLVLRQQTGGDFVLAQQLATAGVRSVAAGDLDRDGDGDVVTVESAGPSRVFTNR